MWKYHLALEKCWVSQSGYFRLTTTLALSMGIIDRKILFCHGISDRIEDKKTSMIKYNDRKFYDCFINTFPDGFGSPALNIPLITIDEIPQPDKRARFTPDMLSSAVFVASETSVSTFTTPSDSTQVCVITYDDTNPHHVMKKYNLVCGRVKIWYWSKRCDRKRCYKK